MRSAIITFSFILTIVVQSCGDSDDRPKKGASPQSVEIQLRKAISPPIQNGAAGNIDISGTIFFLPSQGACYGIMAAGSAKCNPPNLEPGFKKSGLTFNYAAGSRNNHTWYSMTVIKSIDSPSGYHPPSHI
jgi:hypothetical protein